MRNLGVDFASQPNNTAACLIKWLDGRAVVELIERRVDDSRLIVLASSADKIGLDVPFGWPIDFVSALFAHHEQKPWPPATTHALRFRRTDLFVHQATGTWPLSVSTDRIGIAAFRAARLLSGQGVDRTGAGPFVEVYPRAARDRFRIDPTVEGLLREAPWLQVSSADIQQCRESSHCLDAVVAALATRAAALGLCESIPPADRGAASREGWIALPIEGSLQRLP
jgi:predicted nuclease with RNAse H fold